MDEDVITSPAPAPAVEDNPRVSAMDAIAARNDEQLAEQMLANGMDPGFTPGQQAPVPAPAPAGDDPAPTPAPPAPSPAPGPAPAADQQLLQQLGTGEPIPIERLDGVRVRLTVDGKTRDVTMAELRRDAQIDGAARQRLQEATRLLDQVKAMATPAPAPATPAPPVGADGKPTPGDSAATSKDVTAVAKSLVDSLMVGDEDKAAQTLTELLGRLDQSKATPAPSQDDLVSRLVPAVKQQLSNEEAITRFNADFSDIVGNPHLARVGDGFFEEVVQANPGMTFAEALTEAGTRTRAWVQQVSGKPTTEPAQDPTPQAKQLEQRKERKSQIDNVSGVNAKAQNNEPPIPTVSDTIAEMKKARGLE